MHTHQHPTITRKVQPDGKLIVTVVFEDNCSIAFIAPRDTRWNGGWPRVEGTGVTWPAVEVDNARRLAFPEHR